MLGKMLWAFWGVLILVVPVAQGQGYQIKMKQWGAVGKQVRIQSHEKTIVSLKTVIILNDPKFTFDQNEVAEEFTECTETVLEKEDIRPILIQRNYNQAKSIVKNKEIALAYDQRSLQFGWKEGKYLLSNEEFPALPPKDVRILENRTGKGLSLGFADILLHHKFQIGEVWKIDPKLLMKCFHIPAIPVIDDTLSATGELVQVYKNKEGVQFGVIEIKAKVAVSSFPGVTTIDPSVFLEMKTTLDFAIDSSSTESKTIMRLYLKGTGKDKNGVPMEIDFSVSEDFIQSAEQ